MKANSRRWQYSLAGLMTVVAVSSVLCMVAGLVGWGLVLALLPTAWVFWATYRLVDRMIKGDNRNSSLKDHPTRYYNDNAA